MARTVFGDEGMFGGKAAGRWRLVPTRANAALAFALYQRDSQNEYQAFGLHALRYDSGGLKHIVSFIDPTIPTQFGLPTALK